jgi:SWI/SNF-related matrix-associated actin-dependent regulator of chromatin subfamily A member 5
VLTRRSPQADLQAMDRVHRSSQTNQGHVYCFIMEGSVEEWMLERAVQKSRLEQLVIQQGTLFFSPVSSSASRFLASPYNLALIPFSALGRVQLQAMTAANKKGLLEMMTNGAHKIIDSADQ